MAKAKKPLVFAGANEMDAQNLVLLIDNDSYLNLRRKTEFQKNLLRKLKSGKYDFEKSIRLFRFLADEADKAERGTYRRFPDGSMYIDTSRVSGFTYDVPTRNLAARMLAEEFRDQVRFKGPDSVAPYGELTWLALQEGIYKPAKKKAAKKKTAKKKAAKKKTAKKKATKKTNVVMLDEYQKRFG